MIGTWFTVKRMTALRPAIEAMAEQLVDEMGKRGALADLKASVRPEPQAVLDLQPRELGSLELAVTVDDLRRVEGLVVGGLRELPVRW